VHRRRARRRRRHRARVWRRLPAKWASNVGARRRGARERDATAWENSIRVIVSTAPSDSTSRAARETAR
jgi:hypothetical protein